MKKKFNLWLNIATICLCVCAVAIGVYAAQSATLTVSGSVGFTAHGIKYTVSAKVKGYSTAAENGTYYSDWQSVSVADGDKTGDYTLSLGAMYFTDLHAAGVPDIEIDITITNKSAFPVEAKLSLPENTTLLSNVSFVNSHNVIAQMGKSGESTESQTISIVMKLTNTNTTALQTALSSDFGVALNKYQKVRQDDTGYYVSMGSAVTGTGTSQAVKEVKWRPIAQMAATTSNGTTTYGTATAFDYKTTAPVAGNRYYFLSENILDSKDSLSTLPSSSETGYVYGDKYGVAYANELNSNHYSTKTNYTEFYTQDYLISNVRELLTSETGVQQYALWNSGVTPYGSTISLLKEYGLQGYTYAAITPRSASELHEPGVDNKILGDFQEDEQTASDSLWLLSETEANTYFANNTARGANLFRATETTAGSWWLRSPCSDSDDSVWYVSSSGDVSHRNVVIALGVRPAFTLTI